MKKFLTRSFLFVLAFFSLFCLVGCGDEFANAEEVQANEISTYINQEEVDFGEDLESGFRMKMTLKMKGMSMNCDVGILLDEAGEDIEGMAAVIKISAAGVSGTMKAYVKDGMLYTSATGEDNQVVEFTGSTGIEDLADALNELQNALDEIKDYLASNAIELENVVFKKLVGENEGDVKYQIKDSTETATSTIVFSFENNKLVELEMSAKAEGVSTTISFARTDELNFPSDKKLANWA